MIIGIDARLYGPDHRGIGRYTEKLLSHLIAELADDDQLIVFLDQDGMKQYQPVDRRVTKVSAPYRVYSWQEQVAFPLLITRQRVDLMHFTHFNVPLFYRGRFVVTVHDLIISHYPDSRATSRSLWLYHLKLTVYRLVMAHAIRSAEQVITVSQFSKRDIMDNYHLADQRVVVTYEGVDQCPYPADEEAILFKYGIKKPYLLYVGSAYPHKNLEKLVAAFRLIKQRQTDLQLVLVGRQDFFYQRLIEQIKEQGSDNIILPGFVPDGDLPALYQQSIAYVFPSLLEGFGLPPLEAQACGTPIISSDRSCLPEVLGDGALYFNPDNVDDIVRVINNFINLSEIERDRLIAHGALNLKRFAWSKLASKTYEVYRGLNN